MAYQCLKSVPNKPDEAVKLVDSLAAFVQWQSTLAWLKDPPPSYMLEPTDIVGSLSSIQAIARGGGYESEYDFQLALFQLFASAHDGHFSFRGDVFKAFGFRNNLARDIVTVSSDGKEVPKLYNLRDLQNATADRPAPAIVRINGRPAAELIEELNLKFSGYQDPDSQWNSVMQTFANPAGQITVAASLAFQGEEVTLEYDNGMRRSEPSFAILRAGANFTGVRNGEDYYQRFCSGVVPETDAAATTTTTTASPTASPTTAAPPVSPTIEGYPVPVVRDQGANTTAGYFINATGYEDVAVLVVSGFSPAGLQGAVAYLNDFQQTVEKFLAAAKAAGKTKLVIDLEANGGGFVVAGYELFAQLFPDVNRFQADNLRLSKSLVSMARITDAITPEDFNTTDVSVGEALLTLARSSIVSNLIPGGVYTPDGVNFTSVDEIISPVQLKGDLFTAYQQTPLNMTSEEFNLTGTGSRSNPAPSAFRPEDIVLLTDGTCGSTCTLFAYLMVLQLNVQTIAVGGRPRSGPMQSIAGVEGAQVFFFEDLSAAAQAIITLARPEEKADLLSGEVGVLAEGYALTRATNPNSPGAVNGKNAFMQSDSQTPLQFLYQPANCRFYYTFEMLSSPELVWRRAADAAWHDPAANCAEGSRVPLRDTSLLLDPTFSVQSAIALSADLETESGATAVSVRATSLATAAVVVVGMLFALW